MSFAISRKLFACCCFTGFPHPCRVSSLLPACWEGYPASTRSGRDAALPPLSARSVDAELAPDIVGMPLDPALQELRELGIRRIREHDPQLNVLISEGVARACRQALALEPQQGAGVRAAGHLDRDRAMDGRHCDLGAQHRLRQGHGNVDVDVAALALEQRVRIDLDLDIGVARGPAVVPGLALALEAERLPALDARGDREIDAVAIGQRDPLLGAERRLEERDAQAMLGVRAALAHGAAAEATAAETAAGAAEDLRQDVLDGEALRRAVTARPAGAVAIGEAPRRRLGAGRVDLAAVEPRALLGIGQQLVSAGDLLELLLGGLVAGVEVGVKFLCKPPIGLLEILGRRRFG